MPDTSPIPDSQRFFRNTACAYFPCHAKADPNSFNCLFCFCPLYRLDPCPGAPRSIARPDGSTLKDCTACTWPHQPQHYDDILDALKKG